MTNPDPMQPVCDAINEIAAPLLRSGPPTAIGGPLTAARGHALLGSGAGIFNNDWLPLLFGPLIPPDQA